MPTIGKGNGHHRSSYLGWRDSRKTRERGWHTLDTVNLTAIITKHDGNVVDVNGGNDAHLTLHFPNVVY